MSLTLQLNILPKTDNDSCTSLASIYLLKFFKNTLPLPDFLMDESLSNHMIRIGRPARLS